MVNHAHLNEATWTKEKKIIKIKYNPNFLYPQNEECKVPDWWQVTITTLKKSYKKETEIN